MLTPRNFVSLLVLSSLLAGCSVLDDTHGKKEASSGLISTPVSYYSTTKAKYLGTRYKENLDRLVEQIVRNPKTSPLQFANNIASVGGIGFFTHSATKSSDERYLEVVLATPETFETKGDYSEKLQRLFALYGFDLLNILSSDNDIYQDRELSGYGLNLAWRNVVAEPQGSRVMLARAIIYFPKEKVRSYLRSEIKQNDLLADAVIFGEEQDGPLTLVSYRPQDPRPDFRPAIQETNLAETADAKPTQAASSAKPAAEKTNQNSALTKKQLPSQDAATNPVVPLKTRASAEPAATSGEIVETSGEPEQGNDSGGSQTADAQISPRSEPEQIQSSSPNAFSDESKAKSQVALNPAVANELKPMTSVVTEPAADNNQVVTPAVTTVTVPSTETAKPEIKKPSVASAEPAVVGNIDTAKNDLLADNAGANPTDQIGSRSKPTIEAEKPSATLEGEGRTEIAKLPVENAAVLPTQKPEEKQIAKLPAIGETSRQGQAETVKSGGKPDSVPVGNTVTNRTFGAKPSETIVPETPLLPIEKPLPQPVETKVSPVRGSKLKVETPAVPQKPVPQEPSANSEIQPSESRSLSLPEPIVPTSAAARVYERTPQQPVVPITKPADPVVEAKPATQSSGNSPQVPSPDDVTSLSAPHVGPDSNRAKPAEQLASLKKPADSIVQSKPSVTSPAKALEGFIIQIAFSDKDRAQQWAEAMERRGFAVSVTRTGTEGALRVRLGNFAVREDAERQLRTFKQEGLSGIVINLPQGFRPARSSMP